MTLYSHMFSFCEQGTSYTISNLEETCNITTGSNYAKDWEVLRPVRPELWPNGPFLHFPELRVPHFVLTKTHCLGYCDDCSPREYYVPSLAAFEQGCLRAETPNQTGSVHYAASVPVKAVHLYRNPFDNIVARMHLAVHKRERQGMNVTLFTNSREGLREWCAYLDERFLAEEQNFFAPDVLKMFQGLPCHADWYRYVQWHNHAYLLLKEKMPIMDLFYEDYTHRYDATVNDLLTFLELEPRHPAMEFFVGKSYEIFFDAEHKQKAAVLVHSLSLPPVWQRLKRYLEPYLDI
jgi:Sulfotransferase domain